MKHIVYREDIDWGQDGLVAKILGRVLPKANPDFEHRYHKVQFWYLELDDIGRVLREVGLDENSVPVVMGPWGDNHGLWTDSHTMLNSIEYEELAADEFEAGWRIAQSSLTV